MNIEYDKRMNNLIIFVQNKRIYKFHYAGKRRSTPLCNVQVLSLLYQQFALPFSSDIPIQTAIGLRSSYNIYIYWILIFTIKLRQTNLWSASWSPSLCSVVSSRDLYTKITVHPLWLAHFHTNMYVQRPSAPPLPRDNSANPIFIKHFNKSNLLQFVLFNFVTFASYHNLLWLPFTYYDRQSWTDCMIITRIEGSTWTDTRRKNFPDVMRLSNKIDYKKEILYAKTVI